MREVSDNVHNAHRVPMLVLGLHVQDDAEWRAFVEGVREVLHLAQKGAASGAPEAWEALRLTRDRHRCFNARQSAHPDATRHGRQRWQKS